MNGQTVTQTLVGKVNFNCETFSQSVILEGILHGGCSYMSYVDIFVSKP